MKYAACSLRRTVWCTVRDAGGYLKLSQEGVWLLAEEYLQLMACAYDMQHLQATCGVGTNAERNSALRRVFQNLTIDLERRHITAFGCMTGRRTRAGHIVDQQVLCVRPVSRVEALAARNHQLCKCHGTGETLTQRGRQFWLSPQRVHQVIHDERWWEGAALRSFTEAASLLPRPCKAPEDHRGELSPGNILTPSVMSQHT